MRERRGRTRGQGQDLRSVIAGVRRRWRAKLLLRGGALAMGATLLAIVISVFGLEAARFSPGAVTAFRWLTWGGVALVLVFFVLRPLLKRVSDVAKRES